MRKHFYLSLLTILVSTTIAISLTEIVSASVVLMVFSARVERNRIRLSWATASEFNHAGFNVLRSTSENGNFVRINSALIPPNCLTGCFAGSNYAFYDTAVELNTTYFYKLQSVDTSGMIEYFGPIFAMIHYPPSIVISSFIAQAQGGGISINWTTSSEGNDTGFNILRAENSNGAFAQINTGMISGCGGCSTGGNYSFVDWNVVAGQVYYYKLQSVDTYWGTQEFGTVYASIPFPFAYFYQFPWITHNPSQVCLPYPPLEWDSRLGPGGLPLLENVRIIPANVAQGQRYWRITKVKFENIDESGNDHSIYVKVLDENCNRLGGTIAHLTSEGGASEFLTEVSFGDLCNCNFAYPMYGDVYNIHIETLYPSDAIAGMLMPMRRHVNYRITFQLTTKP